MQYDMTCMMKTGFGAQHPVVTRCMSRIVQSTSGSRSDRNPERRLRTPFGLPRKSEVTEAVERKQLLLSNVGASGETHSLSLDARVLPGVSAPRATCVSALDDAVSVPRWWLGMHVLP